MFTSYNDRQCIISHHAVDQFYNRILGLGEKAPKEDYEKYATFIAKILTDCFPKWRSIVTGEITCSDYGAIFCLQNEVVATVKIPNGGNDLNLNGGICRSGKKYKKMKRSIVGPKERRDKPWKD